MTNFKWPPSDRYDKAETHKEIMRLERWQLVPFYPIFKTQSKTNPHLNPAPPQNCIITLKPLNLKAHLKKSTSLYFPKIPFSEKSGHTLATKQTHFQGQSPASFQGRVFVRRILHLLGNQQIVGRIAHNGDPSVVFGCCSEQSYTTWEERTVFINTRRVHK